MDDYTDYHRFSWNAIKPPTPPLLIFLFRLPLYLTILGLIHLTYTSRFFEEMKTDAQIFVFIVVTILSIGLIVILHHILNNINRSRGQKIINYHINRQGIYINKQRYSHSSTPVLHYPNEVVRQKATATLTFYRQAQHKR